VVLLHPVGLDLTCFESLITHFGGRYQILRVDLPGHGHSAALPFTPDLGDYADCVHRLLVERHWTPAHVVGFSFGGMIAQTIAIEHPEDVAALVLCACPSTLSDEVRRLMAQRGSQAEREGMSSVVDATMARWFTEGFRASGQADVVRQRLLTDAVQGWAQAWGAIARLNTAPHLPSIAVPTLCLAGESDLSAPPHVVEEMARQIPHARFAVLPGAPHMLFIEQPQAVATAISAFLDGLH